MWLLVTDGILLFFLAAETFGMALNDRLHMWGIAPNWLQAIMEATGFLAYVAWFVTVVVYFENGLNALTDLLIRLGVPSMLLKTPATCAEVGVPALVELASIMFVLVALVVLLTLIPLGIGCVGGGIGGLLAGEPFFLAGGILITIVGVVAGVGSLLLSAWLAHVC